MLKSYFTNSDRPSHALYELTLSSKNELILKNVYFDVDNKPVLLRCTGLHENFLSRFCQTLNEDLTATMG